LRTLRVLQSMNLVRRWQNKRCNRSMDFGPTNERRVKSTPPQLGMVSEVRTDTKQGSDGAGRVDEKVHERPLEGLKGRLTERSAGRRHSALRRGFRRGRQCKLHDRWNGHESFVSRSHSGEGKFRVTPPRRDDPRAMPRWRDGSGGLHVGIQD